MSEEQYDTVELDLTPDPDEIQLFFHCRQCLAEKPDDQSPREWSRTQSGITKDAHVRVECVRHNIVLGYLKVIVPGEDEEQ